MDDTDWAQVIMSGNEVAMQWYALTHDQPLPGNDGIIFSPIPGVRAGVSSQTIVLLVLGIAALVLFTRK